MDSLGYANWTTPAVRAGPQILSAITKMSRLASCEKRKADLIRTRASSERFPQQTTASRAVGLYASTPSTHAKGGGNWGGNF